MLVNYLKLNLFFILDELNTFYYKNYKA